jgi:Asp-tRNA(Asn)/Glu-tRNA(Gln) amidotransferase A subunit family amidase
LPARTGLLERCLNGELRLDHFLARIDEAEPEVRAWVEVSPRPAPAGPLAGVSFGVKDIFDTAGLPTEYGSPLYKGRRPAADAALVRLLCDAGAQLLGKTHTTAFAYYDPAPTRNPRAPGRTPGGSSSGSAAAVAGGMAAFAVGSQTQGSVIRPASFCGVTGFKPTHGLLPLEGCLPFAPSLDTAGLFTESARDMLLLWKAIGFAQPGELPLRAAIPARGFESEIPLAQAASALRSAGWRIETVDLPPEVLAAQSAAATVNCYEGARTHEARWREHGPAIGAKLAELVEQGLAIPDDAHAAALEILHHARSAVESVFDHWPLILSPAAPGPAPLGYASTGDPRLNRPWTALHVPVISVPLPAGGPPLGLQIAARRNQDSQLLAAACAVEAVLWQN